MAHVNRMKELFFATIRSKAFETLSVFASASIAISLIGGIASIVQAQFIGPDTMGKFQKYNILTRYANILFIPVADGLLRQYPYLIGKGRKDEALAVASMAKCWYVAVTFIICLIFLALIGHAALMGDVYGVFGWFGQLIVSIQLSYGSFLQIIYRRSAEFKRLSYNGLWACCLGVLSLAAVKVFGFFGLAFRVCVMSGTQVFLDAKHLPEKIRCKWNWNVFKNTAKISIPLSVIGYIKSTFLPATFSYLILRYCGESALGAFGVALSFQGFAMLFNNALYQIFNVKVANKFGETDSIRASAKMLIVPTILSVCAAAVLALCLCAVIGPFIRFCVPKYTASIPLVYILSAGIPLFAAALPVTLLKTALLYKTIYFMGILKVCVVIGLVYALPKTIAWLTFGLIAGEFVDILVGYLFLCIHSGIEIRKEVRT